MNSMPELIMSGDGSHSIVSTLFHTPYHSRHGAVTESRIVFIEAALDYLRNNEYRQVDVFEMGFGTGLNALMTLIWAEANQIAVNYHTIEAFPVGTDVVTSLNYGDLLGYEHHFMRLHTMPWASSEKISSYFTFCKWNKKIETFASEQLFDVVFFDAFAPDTQPELWKTPMMRKMYDLLRPNGVLTSFCAQGAFKRGLKEAGFLIERLPGPPGKREMTRAIKS